jgi:hypothetical protein
MNFICISNYNNDISWVKNYPNDYIVYDRSDIDINLTGLKFKKSPNVGYNLYDYFSYIIDNYDNLPEFITFIKGNVFPRHVTKKTFEKFMNKKYFLPIFDYNLHNPVMPVCMFSSDGNYSEINNSWYLNHHPTSYFNNFNDFWNFIFENPFIPQYLTFAPGANYVVPKNIILKYDIVFYKNLKKIISNNNLSGESHIVERALYSIWLGEFKVSENMKKIIN